MNFKLYLKKFFNAFKRTKLMAIFDEDLFKILENLGIIDQIKNGQYKCKYCGKVITLENLWGIKMQNGKINFICSDYNCLNKL